MKKNQLVMILVAAMMIFPAAVFAETIQGVINGLNTASNSLTITRKDPGTGTPEQLNVTILEDTTFEGVHSLGELQVGTQVSIDAAPTAAGAWKAISIKKG